MNIKIRGIEKQRNYLAQVQQEINREISARLKKMLLVVHDAVTEYTPVWTGHALANWQWSTGRAASTVVSFRGPPTPTGGLPLGVEPNRGAARAIANASFAKLPFDKVGTKYYVVNNAQYPDGRTFLDIEYGRMPIPSRDRTKSYNPPPFGPHAIAMQRLEMAYNFIWKTRMSRK
jgi:hypothetical protein